MSPIDARELSLRNRALRTRRLRHIKRSIERSNYKIDSSRLAGIIISEACSQESARRQAD